jgi:hypothetical protein
LCERIFQWRRGEASEKMGSIVTSCLPLSV